jgi:hypothetical protein
VARVLSKIPFKHFKRNTPSSPKYYIK